ncbi:MAG: pyruvate kinase [Allomuricauda sp.]
MATTPEQLEKIALQLDQVIGQIQQQDTEDQIPLDRICPIYQESAKNLLHYSAFRSFDARMMQMGLKQLGLTRLANAEGNILASLMNLKNVVNSIRGNALELGEDEFLSIGAGKRLLLKHTDLLFGNTSKQRRVRIMVTQPTDAAHDYDLVLEMVKNGMDCARINCAHDGPEIWEAIIKNVRKAAEVCSTTVKIAMDLAGPKVRTGSVGSIPGVKKFKPSRSLYGETTGPAIIEMVPHTTENLGPNAIPVDGDWLKKLKEGDVLTLQDVRGKSRQLEVVSTREGTAVLHGNKTVYIKAGTHLLPLRQGLGEGFVGNLPRVEQAIVLRVGDVLKVTGNEIQGSLPSFGPDGNLVEPGKIPCIPSQIVAKVKMGAMVLFDDGKIEGIVEKVDEGFFEVKIIKAKEGGSSLRAEKGINFPSLDLGIRGLTEKDRTDLKFVAQHADIVNCSFINSEEDVREVLEQLEQLGIRDSIGVILKIETKAAYKNLIGILLTAMETKHLGIMIARGDLALEVGWKNMGMVQEGILSFCSAAHIPVVWATQVLESLAKKGVPSRSEITDTASSIKAECVMLNKGPYINEAMSLLDEILSNMEGFREKKEVMLPKMEW